MSEKREQNFYICNIYYKPQTILMQFDMYFPEEMYCKII